MNTLKEIPKVELHVHLDGSVRYETLKEFKNITKEDVMCNNCKNLEEYLTKFNLPIEIMQTKEVLTRVAKELVEDLKKDNVIYAEVRFAPILHTKYLSLEEVVEAVLLGLKDKDLKVNLILCMMRNSNFIENKKIIDLTYKYLNKGVVGIDLAGDEKNYKTHNFKDLFKIINDLKIPFTIHAGEADGIDSILSAINFNAKRIGHGVRCIEDEKVINLIKEKNITLEVCPTSNVDTNICEYIDHPIKQLYDQDVLVTINTDNRTVSNITLTEEYEKLNKYFNFGIEDFKKLNINAINASFLSEEEKSKYINKFYKTMN